MSDRVWTVIEILNAAHHYLEEKGIESARRNAEALLGKATGLARIDLYVQHDRPLASAQVSDFRELLKRRVQREPLQLILGTVDFLGVTLEVVPGLLVPRAETEELAEFVTIELRKSGADSTLRMLDIGAGTGCLAVSIAAKIPAVLVDAVDVDYEAVRCTNRNAALNNVEDRVHGILADVFSERFVSAITPPYDAVVSNPPYVSKSEFAGLAPEIKEHESRHALVAEDSGLAFYRRIADLLPALLKPGGLLAVEIGASQGQSIADIFHSSLSPVAIRNDLWGHARIVTGRRIQEQTSNILTS